MFFIKIEKDYKKKIDSNKRKNKFKNEIYKLSIKKNNINKIYIYIFTLFIFFFKKKKYSTSEKIIV